MLTFCNYSLWIMLMSQSCLTLWDRMNCSPQVFYVHGISRARILEWVAIPFFRESSRPRDWTWVSCTAGRFFTIWATREAPNMGRYNNKFYFWIIEEVLQNIHYRKELLTSVTSERLTILSVGEDVDSWDSQTALLLLLLLLLLSHFSRVRLCATP